MQLGSLAVAVAETLILRFDTLLMEHLAQGEDIQMRPNSAHLLTFSEDRNDEVEVLDQGMTSYHSTEDMCETISLLHYSALTRTIEDDMWIINSGASRHMTGDQARLSNLNERKTSYKVELLDKSTYPVEGFWTSLCQIGIR
jgi:hypothetical protein